MATEDVVLLINKPHLTIKVHKNLLEVDLKKGVKKKLENALETKPILRDSLGYLFQTAVPLDVPLHRIESVSMNKNGEVKVAIPHRRDLFIPLKPNEAKTLVDKLNVLIAIEKQKAMGEDIVMVIKKPHFTVKLHKRLLDVDLKEGVKKELEDAIEARPILRESLGVIFQTIVPLDVPLKDIESVQADKTGQVKVAIPHRRDIFIPLKPDEAKRLVEKMNELIPVEKDRVIQELLESERARREIEPRIAEAEEEAHRDLALPR